MVKFMSRIPAGTFLVPMILSALVYTIWPNLFSNLGGVTDAFLGGSGTAFIIGMLSFVSGMGINFKTIGKLLKHHGVLLLVKFILCVVLGLLYVTFFGQSGIFGISALAFIVALCSINPALYISLTKDFGDEIDVAAFGLIGLFGIPAAPMFIYAISGQGAIDWMPIISTILPLILGIILGNLDKDFPKLFGPAIGVLLPILGWNIGQGMNLIEGVQSGVYGLLLVFVFYFFMSPLYLTDKNLLKKDGVVGLSMTSVAGVSASFPAIIAQANPALSPFVAGATAQIVTATIITALLTPVLVRKIYNKKHPVVSK